MEPVPALPLLTLLRLYQSLPTICKSFTKISFGSCRCPCPCVSTIEALTFMFQCYNIFLVSPLFYLQATVES